jgi:hypothetical protein
MSHIKKIYLYLVSIIALVIMVVGAIMLLNMALKTWVFPKADHVNYYSYPAKVDCERMIAEQKANSTAYVDPSCTDPDYVAKQEARDREQRSAQKQSDAAQALAMILVAGPVWFFHWRLARKEV